MVFGVHLTLWLFLGIDIPGTALFQFVTNPGVWDTSGFLSAIISDITLLVGAGLIVAGTFATRSDIFLFAGMATLFISFGKPLAELFTIISTSYNSTIAMLLVSPIIIIYVMICVAWWRGRA